MQTRAPMNRKLRRVAALVRKESYELIRDPSGMLVGIIMPVMLVLLFGYGLSLDVRHVPVALVMEDLSPASTQLASAFLLSPSFEVHEVTSMHAAEQLMLDQRVKGIIRIRADYPRQLAAGNARVQVIVHGTDANTARIVQGYAEGAIAQWQAQQAGQSDSASVQPIVLESRLWFNESNDSHYYIVPGIIVMVMTLIGALLTAMVMAREWEHGTFEALFATPVRSDEILLGKTVPYFLMGMAGLALCVAVSILLFHVPLRGSVLVLTIVSMLYLLVALGIGLVVSSVTKNQFVASQLAMLLSFLPAMMLSGFLFDLRSMPEAVRLITYLFPARYYVALLQTLFLAGDIWSVIIPNGAVLALMAAALMLAARLATRKRLV